MKVTENIQLAVVFCFLSYDLYCFNIALTFGKTGRYKVFQHCQDSNSILLERKKIPLERFRILSGERLDTYRIGSRYF